MSLSLIFYGVKEIRREMGLNKPLTILCMLLMQHWGKQKKDAGRK